MMDEGWRRHIWIAQLILAVAGLAGAALHAAPLRLSPASQNWPILDAVDLGWLALVVVAVLLPGLSKFTFGGVSVEMQEVKQSADQLVDVISDYANLVQNWSTSAVLYTDLIARASNDAELAELMSNYIRDRMGEARDFLSADPKDNVRVALWIFDPERASLEFRLSVPTFKPTQSAYALREGMIGQAFVEQRRFMEADVTTAPCYKSTRGGRQKPPYRAVWCGPVSRGQERIGMLTIDKKTAALFSAAADDIAKGLAAQCALAIDQYRTH